VSVTEAELRERIAYHRKYHRPAMFAPAPGPIADCAMPSCKAFMHQLSLSQQVTDAPGEDNLEP
jgi:hypothetical protein